MRGMDVLIFNLKTVLSSSVHVACALASCSISVSSSLSVAFLPVPLSQSFACTASLMLWIWPFISVTGISCIAKFHSLFVQWASVCQFLSAMLNFISASCVEHSCFALSCIPSMIFAWKNTNKNQQTKCQFWLPRNQWHRASTLPLERMTERGQQMGGWPLHANCYASSSSVNDYRPQSCPSVILVHAWLFCCVHSPPNSDMDDRIFNVCVWSVCMRIHTGDGGPRFLVISEGFLHVLRFLRSQSLRTLYKSPLGEAIIIV